MDAAVDYDVRRMSGMGFSEAAIAGLLEPYVPSGGGPGLVAGLSVYLDLLIKWNAKTNLTAIREPGEIVGRHFGESLFAASLVPQGTRTLLDFGSGAGFPGLPIALLRPELEVTLAESQNKKASFLREAVRTLGVGDRVGLWPGRVEELPASRMFDVVALRAVDKMEAALELAAERAIMGLLVIATEVPAVKGFSRSVSARWPAAAHFLSR